MKGYHKLYLNMFGFILSPTLSDCYLHNQIMYHKIEILLPLIFLIYRVINSNSLPLLWHVRALGEQIATLRQPS